jgi:hypothetical protein
VPRTRTLLVTAAFVLGPVAGVALVALAPAPAQPARSTAAEPERFTPAQQRRLDAIRAGGGGLLSLADLKLVIEDERRAKAAYPDKSSEQLLTDVEADFVPCTVPDDEVGPNGDSEQCGKRFFADHALVWVVRPEFTRRAGRSAAHAFMARRKAGQHAERLTDYRVRGYGWSSIGPDLVRSLVCKPAAGCTYTQAVAFAGTGRRWTFPFVAEEWVDSDAYSLEDLKRLPSFRSARVETVKVEPSGLRISMSDTATGKPVRQGFTLAPGASVAVNVQATLPKGGQR